MDKSRPILCISDLQIPFEAPNALDFCMHLKSHYRIPDENILNVGDETDNLHGGQWPKDPDGRFSATGELAQTRETLKKWYCAFPEMKLAISNHGLRWIKKAIGAEIPSQMMRSYREIFEAPEGWQWKDEWRFNDLKHPFRMIHGLGYGGVNGHRNAAIDSGLSTVIGHLHSHAGICYLRTLGGLKIWGFNTGSLIDSTQYAFSYGKYNRMQPCLGVGVIFNQGQVPMWHPYE